MSNCNAVKLRDPNQYQKPTIHNLAHNTGLKSTSYWLDKRPELIQSRKFKNKKEVKEFFDNLIDEAKKRYKESHTNNLRSDACVIEECLLIIGTDVNATTEDVIRIIKEFIKYFEEKFDTRVIHWAYHDHEGHRDEKGNAHINRHVHILYDNVNKNGEMVRRNMKKDDFVAFQDDIYEISKKYIPDIQRAEKSIYIQITIDGKSVSINTKKGKSHRHYRDEQKQQASKRSLEKMKKVIQQHTNNQHKMLELHPEIETSKKTWFDDIHFTLLKLKQKNKQLAEELLLQEQKEEKDAFEDLIDQLEQVRGNLTADLQMNILKLQEYLPKLKNKINENLQENNIEITINTQTTPSFKNFRKKL